MLVNTPYDDVFKTLVNDCPQLLIPLENNVFHEHFTGREQVISYSNEHFINQANGQEKERITDTFFEINGMVSKKYHLECQSNDDSIFCTRKQIYSVQ